jgi:hypothetical protein
MKIKIGFIIACSLVLVLNLFITKSDANADTGGNDFIQTELMHDLPVVYGARDYKVLIGVSEGLPYSAFTTGWLGVYLVS